MKHLMINKVLILAILTVLAVCILSSCRSREDVISGLYYADNEPISIKIKDGIISDIRRPGTLIGEESDRIIAPGFIDNQVNGFAGVSFTFGGGELTSEGVKKAAGELWKTGVTTFVPTLTTNSKELLIKNFSVLAGVIDSPELLGSIPGFHLEGPYISPVDGFRGAHPLSFVRKPDWNEFMELNRASNNRIIQVTLAPETEGALDFISRCKAEGIIVGIGHHNADAETIAEAAGRGAAVATHLGNGCANMINRHNNPLWPQLSDDRIAISIICDGFHLTPEEIRTFYKVKGPEKTIITSDVTSYAALPPGKFVNIEGDTLELTPEGMVKYPAQNVLAGSASPLKKGIFNIIRFTGCSLADAVRMVTANPAELYGFNDRGFLEKGKRADLVLFRLTDNEIEIVQTIVRGKTVYQKE
ncbi:MAG TPA: N-acetylglucosamine-6-phosphate deacetylase [Bacteroidales bacterium]|nr:N-acetylglucosamine-6-phosphate deacetylase [Bacteroidales bacterium]